jgi:hypothetical protein
LATTPSTCANTPDECIILASQQFGREPFSYEIIAGDDLIKLSDSCGALPTKAVTIPTIT